MKKYLLILLTFTSLSSSAVEGVYLGGRLGHLGLTGTTNDLFDNALSYGVDLGFRTGAMMDLVFTFHGSSHNAGFSLYAPTILADFRAVDTGDYTVTLGIGPGLYLFNFTGTDETQFGLVGSIGGDVWLDDRLRLGLDFRYNGVFGGTVADSFYTVMTRIGYVFET